MPRRIWQRMTPELPRAPMSDPLAIARQAAPIGVAVGGLEVERRRAP